jgi:hypothetical protein
MTANGPIPKRSANQLGEAEPELVPGLQRPVRSTPDHGRSRVKHFTTRPLKRRAASQWQATP